MKVDILLSTLEDSNEEEFELDSASEQSDRMASRENNNDNE